ncbi:ABC transporter ATP-binding protein [Synechocystis sp. CS-94]|uniref:ABC transporter ATP-binding protein n=1 Tax=Synechocystis sp. CS-94 TaxID=2847986 RepID=UPI0004D139AD|nr:ABC transporter ATP-binding protein [Synechocystis sp. CS-94]AIE74659.1 Multidrug resistance ABC transporter ATP-binding and permease protein [Synechocystis sp. PCC 6714]MCT0253985.1 ABC transporter ATP-binding protein/permease [Synechocystis sp. CS-94]
MLKKAQLKHFQGKTISKFGARYLKTEADRLILQSAWENRGLILANFATGIVGALFEGGTFGIIFLAVTLLSEPQEIDWNRYALLAGVPRLTNWLNALGQETLFLLLLALAVTAQILLGLCNYWNAVTAGDLGVRLQVKFTEYLHRLILSFSFACASRYKVGDLTSYAASAGPTVKTQITLANTLISNCLLLLVYLAILVAVSPWLLLAALITALVFYGIQKQLLPRIRYYSSVNEMGLVEISKQVTENLQGLRLLHTTGRHWRAVDQVKNLVEEVKPGLQKQIRLLNITNPITQTLPVVLLAVIAAIAFLLFSQRSTGVLPSLVTFVLALQRFNIRLQGVIGALTGFASNHGSLGRFQAILDRRDKEFARLGEVPFTGLETDIRFAEVSLCYQVEQGEVLRNIDLVLPREKVTALVGQSGAGKSSLADLLVGLYEPTQGQILVNGRDLRQYDLTSWRQRLGVVSQDTFLFNATILDNIRFTCPTATDWEVITAAKAAQADGFIQDLPLGYRTVVGERGYRLSGGQRQRLALARAILSDPDLLILDEATSALDTVSERLVQQALDKFGKNRTVLVIAHRLSTIVNANQIVVMEQGRIVERGNHQQLLDLGGSYAHYWSLQSDQRLEVNR